MKKIHNLTGIKKSLYNNYIKAYVFLHFLKELAAGRLPAKNFGRFLKRLLLFLSKMKDNKYVRRGNEIKMNLYVPAFPTKAFFKACRKVIVSDNDMPCVSVLLSVTSACRYNCEHCYQKLDIGKDIDIDLLCRVTQKLDSMGISFFNIEGGEPFLVFDRLKKLCQSINTGEIWINTTGDKITLEKLAELKKIGLKGLMFSIHSAEAAKINSFMKNNNAYENLVKGIELCHMADLDVAANTCIPKQDYYNGNFESILQLSKELGVSILQLIKPKPSGAWLGTDTSEFNAEDLKYIESKVHKYNNSSEYIGYPFIAAQIIDERKDMFGCTSGGTDRFYINAKGDVQPCEFLNISFGNIGAEDFDSIYERMRTAFRNPGCEWLCETCSKSIKQLFDANHLKALPLSPELSRNIINNMERGNSPDFYEKIAKI